MLSPNQAPISSRRLGEIERILHIIHRQSNSIALQVLHIRGPVTEALVRKALDHLQQTVPVLKAHIKPRGVTLRREVPFFAIERDLLTDGTTAIPLRTTGGDWREAMRHEFRTPLADGNVPRMRAVLVGRDDDGLSRLILTEDHGLCDLPSALFAARTVMEFFANPTKEAVATGGLPPALEDCFPKRPSSSRKEEPIIRLPAKRSPGPRDETHIAERVLGPSETAALHEAAGRHRATVHGTLAAALLGAVRDLYGVDAMTLLSNFEFRRLCEPPLPPETFGCYIDSLRTTHALGGEFWSLAREVAFKLIATVARDRTAASILKLPAVPVFLREGPKLAQTLYRLDGVSLTTGGDSGLSRGYGDFELVDLTTGLSMHYLATGIFVTTFEREGALKLMIGYAPHVMPASDVAAIADATIARLSNLPA